MLLPGTRAESGCPAAPSAAVIWRRLRCLPLALSLPAEDTTAPAIALPAAPGKAQATGPGGAIVTYGPASATDAVDVSVAVACSPASGALFSLGNTAVTCTATDAANNTASGTFLVTVGESARVGWVEGGVATYWQREPGQCYWET